MNNLHLVCDGDSWTFGSEIADPALIAKNPPEKHITSLDWTPANDSYRKTKIYPYHLGQLLNASRVTNLSWPADDNLTIIKRTMSYIMNNYIVKNVSTENLFVVIGWTSPERTHFYFKDDKVKGIFRIRPQDGNFESEMQKKFWEMYVEHIWNPEQYFVDYLLTVLQFQNFCKLYNINYLCFNAFYQVPKSGIFNWKDLCFKDEYIKLKTSFRYQVIEDHISNRNFDFHNYINFWNEIDGIKFYKKDIYNNTFKTFIQENNKTKPFNGLHPSETSHRIWAKELYRYILENKLINFETL